MYYQQFLNNYNCIPLVDKYHTQLNHIQHWIMDVYQNIISWKIVMFRPHFFISYHSNGLNGTIDQMTLSSVLLWDTQQGQLLQDYNRLCLFCRLFITFWGKKTWVLLYLYFSRQVYRLKLFFYPAVSHLALRYSPGITVCFSYVTMVCKGYIKILINHIIFGLIRHWFYPLVTWG